MRGQRKGLVEGVLLALQKVIRRGSKKTGPGGVVHAFHPSTQRICGSLSSVSAWFTETMSQTVSPEHLGIPPWDTSLPKESGKHICSQGIAVNLSKWRIYPNGELFLFSETPF